MDEFEAQVTANEHITQAHRLFGDPDYILKIMARDLPSYQQFFEAEVARLDVVRLDDWRVPVVGTACKSSDGLGQSLSGAATELSHQYSAAEAATAHRRRHPGPAGLSRGRRGVPLSALRTDGRADFGQAVGQ
ncbi:MAG: Lrp/AsnC ligand binding domain-containing protein [Actinomycetota bacterium]|nr:Lrp/AsnC ligand binding domain-containing protein [Actinomycetota bacterium]